MDGMEPYIGGMEPYIGGMEPYIGGIISGWIVYSVTDIIDFRNRLTFMTHVLVDDDISVDPLFDKPCSRYD